MGSRVRATSRRRGRREACSSPHTGFMFGPNARDMSAGAAGGASCASISGASSSSGALLGMVLPALLYVTFLPRGTDIRGLGHQRRAGANASARSAGPLARRLIVAFSARGSCSRRSSTPSMA